MENCSGKCETCAAGHFVDGFYSCDIASARIYLLEVK